MKFNVYLKAVSREYYYSVDLGYLAHKGDVITLGGEQFIVIGGQALPRERN